MRNKDNFPLFLGIAIAIGIFIGSTLDFPVDSNLFVKNNNEQKIKKLMQFIEQDYVDKVDTDALLDNVIGDVIAKLDPHSVYFPKDIYSSSQENLQGNFEGIGVQFQML